MDCQTPLGRHYNMALGAPIGVPDVIACNAKLRALLRAYPGKLNSERCPENTPEISQKSRSHTHPPPSCDLFYIFRGKCCAFFPALGWLFRVLLFLGVPMFRVLWGGLRRYLGTFFGARLSCRGIVIWLDFGLRTPRGFSPVAFFFRGFLLFLCLPPLLLLLLLSGGRLGCLFFVSFRASCRTAPDFRYLYRPGTCLAHVFSFSSVCPGRPPPPCLPPSFCPLSLSLSLFLLSLSLACMHRIL